MCSEGDSAERSGSALGLAEVLSVIGHDRLMKLLKKIVESASYPKACVREGVMWFISYLPYVIQERISDTINIIFPVIVRNLSDETEIVNQVSLKAGAALINKFGTTNTKLILTPILNNILSDNWRYRQSATLLLGQLLYLYNLFRKKLSGKKTINEDEINDDDSDDDEKAIIADANTSKQLSI